MKSSVLRQALILLAWGLAAMLLAIAVPRCEGIFKDFGMPLPRITILIARASQPGWIWLPLALIPPGVDLFFFSDVGRNGETSLACRLWTIVAIAVPVFLISTVLWAIAVPFFTSDFGLGG
jgi:type II secretory pathway component PulF